MLTKTGNATPANATHWSRALITWAMGINPSNVGRIWAEAALEPHLARRFKISNDPKFDEKVTAIVGFCTSPPDRALVLCVDENSDENSRIQALDRSRPGLPLTKRRAAIMTQDYNRNGTKTLFAALDGKMGLVIGECEPRNPAKEFLGFVKRIDGRVKTYLSGRFVPDNYGTRKTPKVKAWLVKHPRLHPHVTRKSASLLNLVERLFGEITGKRIRRDTLNSMAD